MDTDSDDPIIATTPSGAPVRIVATYDPAPDTRPLLVLWAAIAVGIYALCTNRAGRRRSLW